VLPETETPVPSAGVSAPADSSRPDDAKKPDSSVNDGNLYVCGGSRGGFPGLPAVAGSPVPGLSTGWYLLNPARCMPRIASGFFMNFSQRKAGGRCHDITP